MNQAQYENSMLLRQVILDKIARDEPIEVLDSYAQPCGTYGCVAGNFVIASGFGGYNLSTPDENLLHILSVTLDESFDEYFGFAGYFGYYIRDNGETNYEYVFGSSDTNLHDRLEYVESQIIENGYSLEG